MREEGPVPPLLLTGHPGLGKSTLLAKWYVTMVHNASGIIIHVCMVLVVVHGMRLTLCECCPGCALQLFCWMFLSMYELYAVIQTWLLALSEHVCCLGTSNK